MATFIFKANADGFPNGNPDPSSPLDWEGGTFRSPLPKTLVGQVGKPPLPVSGDRIELWVNEGSRDKALRGHGYVGRGTIKSFVTGAMGGEFILSDIVLSPVRVGGGIFDNYNVEPIRSLNRYRLHQLLSVNDEQAAQFQAIVSSSEQADLRRKIASHDVEIENAFRVGEVRQRTSQGEFRAALLKHYDYRCCITGSQPSSALEAAHIVPVSIDPALHNNLGNGILLRADLHRLFDAELLGVEPVETKLQIARSLKGTDYERFQGMRLSLDAQPAFLERRFRRFCEVNNRI